MGGVGREAPPFAKAYIAYVDVNSASSKRTPDRLNATQHAEGAPVVGVGAVGAEEVEVAGTSIREIQAAFETAIIGGADRARGVGVAAPVLKVCVAIVSVVGLDSVADAVAVAVVVEALPADLRRGGAGTAGMEETKGEESSGAKPQAGG